ncbi:MAG: zinc-ribbon domain-containing protein [Chlamydiae bacterium]|nr:zinc-ribbon domain-containing protein [Chlamydiota bacterium]
MNLSPYGLDLSAVDLSQPVVGGDAADSLFQFREDPFLGQAGETAPPPSVAESHTSASIDIRDLQSDSGDETGATSEIFSPSSISDRGWQARYVREHAAASQWVTEKNGEIGEATCGERRQVWWECDQGHEWKLRVYDRCRRKMPSACPTCKPRSKRPTRYLKDNEAANQWMTLRNGEIGEATCSERRQVWWQCDLGHEWVSRIYVRCRKEKPTACPKCRPKKKKPKRYLKNHELASQWMTKKNGEIGEITCGSNKTFWWKCKQGHKWQARVFDRCRGKTPRACPTCKPRKKRAAEDLLKGQPAKKRR